MRPLLLLVLLAGCQRVVPLDPDTSAPFEETLDPASMHLLATALPSFSGMPALVELDLAFEERWRFELLLGGAEGAWRLEGGDTVFAATNIVDSMASSVVRIEADGTLVWDYDDLFLAGLGFSHGVVATPSGDWITLDTTGGRLVSFDEDGNTLWTYDFHEAGEPGSPNGIATHTTSDDRTLMAVSALDRSEGVGEHQLVLLEWSARDQPPVELWRWALQQSEGMVFPHGPRITDDGLVLICLSSLGQVVALDLEGQEQWRIPAAERGHALAFPRDAWFLADGSLIVADGASELVRVHDPFGAFEIVSAVSVPDIFSVHPVVCGEDEGLPCLGG